MPRYKSEIKRLLERGISVTASANDFNVYDLKRLVEAAVEGGTVLVITHSDSLGEYEIRRIADEGSHHVEFR
jgi:hypothetical protein